MTLQISTLFGTCFTSILILLFLGIIAPRQSQPSSLNILTPLPPQLLTTNLIKMAFVVSIAPSIIVLTNHQVINNTQWTWLSIDAFTLSVSFRYDIYSIVFSSIALFITWCIVEFSLYYMSSDPNITLFFRFLTIFLMAMILLISASNMFQLLIGWEGVGFLSFLLIGWWFTRADANTAALQAIIYNRIGDIGILLASGWLIIATSSWSLDSFFALASSSSLDSSLFLWGCLLAATGKSAQFGLHPWLPAAMEGPTPVSALLHSSTMVVAGVFLLVRVSPLITPNTPVQQAILVLGAITALFAASCAIVQNDIKKIVAFSTTSQLGLMVFAIGLNLPLLAFFHICTHGFFKAMLFLCSGSVIHSASNEQDLRKMGGLAFSLPVTSACLTLGSAALFGTPFLAGFYSKDLILETATASFTNLITLTLAMLATGLTAAYSARIILAAFSQSSTLTPSNPISEEYTNLTNPIKRLALGAGVAGWALFPLLTNEFISPVPFFLKTLALAVTILGLVLGSEIARISFSPLHFHNLSTSSARNFITSFWFFPETAHFTKSLLSLSTSQTFITRLFDFGWGEQLGAQGAASLNKSLSQQTQTTQSGLIKQYLVIALISLLLTLAVASAL